MKANVKPTRASLTPAQKNLLMSKLNQVAKTVDGFSVYDKGWSDDRVLRAMGGDPYKMTHIKYYRQALLGRVRAMPSHAEREDKNFRTYEELRDLAVQKTGWLDFVKNKGIKFGSVTKAQLEEFLASAPPPSPKPLPPEPQKPRDYDLLRVELDEAHKRIDAIEAFIKNLEPNWRVG